MSSSSAATGGVNGIGPASLSATAKSDNASTEEPRHGNDDKIISHHADFTKPPGLQASRISSPTKRKRSETDNRVCKFSRQTAGERLFSFSDQPAAWKEEVKDALRKVQQESKDKKLQLMKKILQRNTSALLNLRKSANRKRKQGRRLKVLLSSPHEDTQKPQELDSTSELAGELPIPRDITSTIFLKRLFSLHPGADEDEDDESSSDSKPDVARKCDEIGNLGIKHAADSATDSLADDVSAPSSPLEVTDTSNGIVSNNIEDETFEFRDIERVGVGYEKIETNQDIENVLKRLHDIDHDPAEVRSYLHYLLRTPDRAEKKAAKNEAEPETKTPYERAMSSFRDLYCRRCCIYDCHLHGLADHFDPDLQADLAFQKELDGHWMVSPTETISRLH